MQEYKDCTLLNKFIEGKNTRTPFLAHTGEKIGEWTILGFWVNGNNLLKAVKVQCSCGAIDEYKSPHALKDGTSTKCRNCSNGHPSHYELHEIYGEATGEKLWRLWNGRFRATKLGEPDIRKRLHNDWMDAKTFAAYIINVPEFDKWPEYKLDRIDNDLPYGYQPGNIRFTSCKENIRNKTGIRKVSYRGREYIFTEFLELITGTGGTNSLYHFMYNRIIRSTYTVVQALNELYARQNHKYPWTSTEVKDHFLNWYRAQVNQQTANR